MAPEEAAQESQQPPRSLSELASSLQRSISESRSKVERVAATFRRSLQPIGDKVARSAADEETLPKQKLELKGLEHKLNKTLAVKSCKEVKYKSKEESLSTKKVRIKEVEKLLQETRTRKEKLAKLVSQKLQALETFEEKCREDDVDKEDHERALSWYRKVLGFLIEGGEGVKFFFNKIDQNDPEKEFSFAVQLEGDTYILLQCNPILQDAASLVEELNQTNDFYKFVRAMRKLFLAYSVNESIPAVNDQRQDFSTNTVSSPPPISEDTRVGSSTEGAKEEFSFPMIKKRISRGREVQSPKPVSARRSPLLQIARMQ